MKPAAPVTRTGGSTPASLGETPVQPAEPAAPASGGALQRLRLRQGGELANRVLLDLASALAGQVEDLAHLVERPGRLPVEAIAELHDPALAVGEVVERL